MKQNYLITAIAAEILLLICAIVLTALSPYLWAAVGLFSILLVFTVFLFTKDYANKQEEKQQMEEQLSNRNFQWMEAFKSDLTETLHVQHQKTDAEILKLAELHEQLTDKNSAWMDAFRTSMTEMLQTQHQETGNSINKLAELHEQLSAHNFAWMESFRTSMTEMLQTQHQETTDNIGKLAELQERLSVQNSSRINAFEKSMTEMLQTQHQENSDGISKLTELQEQLLKDNLELCSNLTGSVQALRDENGESMQSYRDTMEELVHSLEENIRQNDTLFAKAIAEMHNSNDTLLQTGTDQIAALRDQQENNGQQIREAILHMNKMQFRMLEDHDTQSQNLRDDVIEMSRLQSEGFQKLSAHTSEEMRQLSEKLKTYSFENAQKMTDRLDELSDRLEEQQHMLSKTHSDSLNELCLALGKHFEGFSENYNAMMLETTRQHKEQLTEVRDESTALLSLTEETLRSMLDTADERTADMRHSADEALQADLEHTRTSLTALLDQLGSASAKRLAQIEAANVRMSDTVSGMLDKKITEMTEAVTLLTNENTDKLMSAYDSTVQRSAEKLTEENENLQTRQGELLSEYLEQLSETYRKLLEQHTSQLSEQIHNKIMEFAEENRQAAEDHNERTLLLLEQETKFVGELTENNEHLRSTIAEAFQKYSDSAAENVNELEVCILQKLEDEIRQNAAHLNAFSAAQEQHIGQLDEKLCGYSDSLVSKSAEAVAALQLDNHKMLQKLGESVTGFAAESSSFAQQCTAVNDKTNQNIERLIGNHAELVSDLGNLSEKSIDSMGAVLDKRISDLTEMLEMLNTDNANAFHASMEDYREKFIESNATALADVQKDNVDAVTAANEKIAELAEKLEKVNEQLPQILKILNNTIDSGMNTFNENSKTFHDNMSGTVEEKLDEYNETFGKLKNMIEEVMQQCQNNTESYQETLKRFTERQHDANQLAKQDLELLQKLVKR